VVSSRGEGRWSNQKYVGIFILVEDASELVPEFLRQEELPSPANIEPVADALLGESQSLSKYVAPVEIFTNASPIQRPSAALLAHKKVTCELCSVSPEQPFLVNVEEWTQHLKSKGHKRRLESKKKRERNMEYLRQREERLRAAEEVNDPPITPQNVTES
jgi:hypothetical protein